ncbi:unnamed protein product [Clavelina lepadiformis]|uniref:Alpha-1,3-mannosyl-glycoprotein 2-beta-N-acetylglucosaminyltransferase n=1 Tax=Clavelina lepadiformis TaxID=159417 RepID=A0ABP0F8R4_CLALP
MRGSFNRKLIFVIISFTCVFCYFTFFYGLLEQEDYAQKLQVKQIKDLHDKMDKVSKNLKENQSFLDKLHRHFEVVIAKEAKVLQNLTTLTAIKPQKLPSRVTIPVLVLVYNRPSVSRCLDLLLKYKKTVNADFPIVVSQDGNHQETTNVIQTYGQQISHFKHPDEPVNLPSKQRHMMGYYKISSHYKWAISQVFQHFSSAETLIIVEDDLEISPDFFSYFFALYDLFMKDQSLYCVSAWNDNGKQGLIDESGNNILYRSDFFPGLGWMLKKSTWMEWKEKWPSAYWDDWVREPSQRKERACIRPEISRTKTFGKIGVSNGQFYEKHLKHIILNSVVVDWADVDLSYLNKVKYDKEFLKKVYKSPLISLQSLQTQTFPPSSTLRLEYIDTSSFVNCAKILGVMEDFKAGVARTAYHGVVTVIHHSRRIYIAPKQPWSGYNPR